MANRTNLAPTLGRFVGPIFRGWLRHPAIKRTGDYRRKHRPGKRKEDAKRAHFRSFLPA